MDSTEYKGKQIRTLEVTDPNVRGKEMVVRSIPFFAVFFLLYLGYMAFVYSKDDSTYQMVYFFMMIFFVSMTFITYLLLNSVLGRTWQKIIIYENGIQFPNYLWDRIRGKASFLPKASVSSVKAMYITLPNHVGVETADLSFRTSTGKIYSTGFRIASDITSLSDWLETDWHLKVEGKKVQVNPIARAHKVPVVNEPVPMTCLGCGYVFKENLGFCPSCGKMTPNGSGQNYGSVTQKSPERAQTPVDPQPYQSQQPQVQNAPPVQSDHGQSLPPNPQYQYAPPYQNAYARPEYPAAQSPYPQYGQYPYPPAANMYGKDPRTARILAALGLLGLMGLGHIYMRKFVVGFLLLFVGGFLALMSLASIYLIFQPNEFSLGVNIVTAAIFTVPFLILLVWQMFDAPKPPRSTMPQYPYGYNRPP